MPLNTASVVDDTDDLDEAWIYQERRSAKQSTSLVAKIATKPYRLERDLPMPTRNVHLTEHLDNLITTGIESGQFSNASEVVREGLRLLEQRQQEDQAKVEWLRNAAQDGVDAIERGEYIALYSRAEIGSFIRSVAKHEDFAGARHRRKLPE